MQINDKCCTLGTTAPPFFCHSCVDARMFVLGQGYTCCRQTMATESVSQFYKTCLKAHGYKSLDTDSDADKSQSDEELCAIKPPPIPYQSFKDRIVKVNRKQEPSTQITGSTTGESGFFYHNEDLDTNNFTLVTYKRKRKKKGMKKK